MIHHDDTFWKHKLLVILKSSRGKFDNISPRSEALLAYAQTIGLNVAELADWDFEVSKSAAVIDGFPFPKSVELPVSQATAESGCHTFKHPFCGSAISLITPQAAPALEESIYNDSLAAINLDALPEERRWWARYFLHWRFWPILSAVRSPALAYLPADRRMPDHTVWNHMNLAAALEGCRKKNQELKPAFLMLQLEGADDFISQAHRHEDMVSGSLLLSWLMIHAIKTITDRIGPDAIIHPSLRGQPLFDLLHCEDLYELIRFQDKSGASLSLGQRLRHSFHNPFAEMFHCENATELEHEIPAIPQQFLALVPAFRAKELAKLAEQAVIDSLTAVGARCWHWLRNEAEKAGIAPDEAQLWQHRWEQQIVRFPRITWQVTPWLMTTSTAMDVYRQLPLNRAGRPDSPPPIETLELMTRFICTTMPWLDRDRQFFAEDTKIELATPWYNWLIHYAIADFSLACRGLTVDFIQWDSDDQHTGIIKDSLTGREEIIGNETFWQYLTTNHRHLFSPDTHRLGAMNLIKRLWRRNGVLNKDRDSLLLNPNGREILDGREKMPAAMTANSQGAVQGKTTPVTSSVPLTAVIMLDGDDIRKWLDGEMGADFLDQLEPKLKAYFEKLELGEMKQPFLPSHHLEFSEALANFALHVVPPIMRQYQGQVISAGGDTVLAMTSASAAIPCASTLRAGFRGDTKDLFDPCLTATQLHTLFQDHPGFMHVNYLPHPVLVPGPRVEISAGIAIGATGQPYSILISAARQALQRAKTEYGRGALAVTVLKINGKSLTWGANWNTSALPLYFILRSLYSPTANHMEKVQNNRQGKKLTLSSVHQFVQSLAERLAPYRFQDKHPPASGFDAAEIVREEFRQAMRQCDQRGVWWNSQEAIELQTMACAYLDQLKHQCERNGHLGAFADFINLFFLADYLNTSEK